MHGEEVARAQIDEGLHGLLRIHVLALHEPGGIVGADGKKRRVDPGHWLDPKGEGRKPRDRHEKDPGAAAAHRLHDAAWESRALAAGRSMVRDGLIREGSFWGTINCDGLGPNGDLCGVTTTSGLAWKIPGRVGDSPIVGAGQYCDNTVGAAGSTGRGESNIMVCGGFLTVEHMRRGMSPTDACLETLRRVVALTPPRLLDDRGRPTFGLTFYAVNKNGEYGAASMFPGRYAVHDGREAAAKDAAFLYERR